jgi:hypothetical protein
MRGQAEQRDGRGGRLPDFLGIGVQKGGTTTLQHLLEQHPGVFLPASKEQHFFSLHYAEGEPWYRQRFIGAEPQHCCGEITPYYIFHPEAPQRIQALLPDVRLIVLLRDPVERALSQYFHARRHGFETLPLSRALALESERLAGAEQLLKTPAGRHRSHQEHSYLARSRYEQQLQRYTALFSAEQLLLLRSEDLFHRPAELWARVLHFLELEPLALPAAAPANAGAGEAAAVPSELRGWLREQLAPTYQAMQHTYGLCW